MQGAASFFIVVIAFGFAFFVISFNGQSEQFNHPAKAFLKIIVMVLGEFEFDDLYEKSTTTNIFFTMALCSG